MGLAARPGRLALCAVLVAVALRLGAGLLFPGFHTGDDVEIIESALAAIGAIDYEPWPIRNQLLPRHLLGPVLGAAAGLGLTEPHGQIVFLRLIFACAGGLTVWLTWRLGRGLFERREVAALGALLMAFHPLAIAFGATTLPRGVSTAAIVGAACLVLVGRGSGGPAQRLFVAGALVAAAFACRYSEAVFLPPLVVAAIAANPATRLRSAGALVAGFVAGAIVLVGLEDWWVYGSPFASLREFAQYTLVERQASARVAVQPVEWYLRRLPFWIPASLLPAFFFVDRSSAAVRRLALMVVLPVLLLSLVHHKDLRYLNGVLPFVALLGAAGLVGLASRGRRPRMVAAALVAITLALGVYRAGRTLIDNSNASVEAARLLAATPEVEAVGVTQLWAFGGRAYLRDKTELVELGVGPAPASLEPLLAGLDAVAIHRRSLAASPRLMPLLRARGFETWQTVEGWADDRVALLKRAPASAASATRAPIRSTLGRSSLACLSHQLPTAPPYALESARLPSVFDRDQCLALRAPPGDAREVGMNRNAKKRLRSATMVVRAPLHRSSASPFRDPSAGRARGPERYSCCGASVSAPPST